MSVIIIAEAGVNHNGDPKIASRLVQAAAEAGADAVKFQTFKATDGLTRNAKKANYQKLTTGEGETQFEMIKRLELSRHHHVDLIKECAIHKIEFLSTPFDLPSIELLVELGIRIFKVPSGEIVNLPYLRQLGRLGKDIILSTGMANLGEIESAIAALEEAGTPRSKITVLHCNSEYPTPMRDVNLRAMLTIREAFGVKIGYSDHTLGIEVPIAAVALGAIVIEKHLTLDRSLPGPDHQASLEPAEFKAMVTGIRNIEAAMGNGIKCPTASESKNIPIARKSIVAGRYIRAGDLFTCDNLTCKRPGTGISPMQWDNVLGKRASRDFQHDELISIGRL